MSFKLLLDLVESSHSYISKGMQELGVTFRSVVDGHKVLRAEDFARGIYGKDLRRDGVNLAISHPEAVVSLLIGIGVKDPDVLSAAWLHDVIEDYDVTKAEIEMLFGSNVSNMVEALTRDVTRGEYRDRIRASDFSVQIIKLADTVHNCSVLPNGIKEGTIAKKKEDCEKCFYDLAEDLSPEFYLQLHSYLRPFEN